MKFSLRNSQRWRGACLTLLGLCVAGLTTSAALAANLPGKVCHLPGQDTPLRCVRVSVPLDYSNPSAGQIQLHVTIAPAFRENAKPDPVFILAGGPGQSGSSIIGLLDSGLQRVRATRDIVFIDQRGTGKSGKLSCDSLQKSDTLDPDVGEQEVITCLQSLRSQLPLYGTAAAVQDMDKVRQQLGFSKINLWGGSYGTRLAQAYAHQFPAQLRSMVIDGVTSPQQNIGLMGAETGRAFQLLREKCQQDKACHSKFPQFAEHLQTILERAQSGKQIIHFKHPVTGKDGQMPLRFEGLAEVIRSMLYHPSTASRLPWLIEQAYQDNWQPLLAISITNQSWSQDGMALGLTMAVLCAEDVGYITSAQAQAEVGRSFLADSWTKKMQRWCSALNLPQQPRPATGPLQVPTLVLSGQYDPVTPPARAQQAMQFLAHGQHLIAPQVGHIVTPHGCTSRLLRQFFDEPNKKVDGACLAEMGKAPFVMSASGAEP